MPKNRTIKTFRLRQNFLSDVVDVSGHDNFYDSSTVKHYGKVDHSGNIVYPSEKYFRALSNPNKTSGNTFYVFNFVAKAFSDFRDYYIKGIATGIVKNDNTRLLEPIRGWESMHKLYAQNIDGLYSVIINGYMQSPNQFFDADNFYPKDFDHFIASFKKLSTIAGRSIKLSRSSFVLSTSCPLSTTGLAIEIGPTIGYSNIRKTVNNFYYDENFDFYMKALKKFGFMADVDYPGRIVADIGSPAMQAYMENFGITFDNLFERYYYKAGDYDYDLIKIYLYQFYNNYVTDYPLKTVVKNQGSVRTSKYSVQAANFRASNTPMPMAGTRLMCEKTTTEIIRKSKLTQNDLNNEYDNSYWLNVYAEVLNYELGSVLDNYHLDKTMNNAQDINKNIDFDSAKSYINSTFKNLRFPSQQGMSTATNVSTSTVTTTTQAPQTNINTTATSTSTSGGSTSGGSSGGGGAY